MTVLENIQPYNIMKKEIIELINKCITNKEYMLNPIVKDGLPFQSVRYTKTSFITTYTNIKQDSKHGSWIGSTQPYKSLNNQERHYITFNFEDEPSITINSIKDGEDLKGTLMLIETKSLFGFKYNKKVNVDVINQRYKYVLLYGNLQFDMHDFEVNDIVKDYLQNIADFREVKYKEQVKERIEKYS